MLSIITNEAAIRAANSLKNNQISLNQSIAQLSTGKRIVNASDDPAGLAISLEISGLLGALNQNSINAQNAQGLLQTADGALANIGNALQTMQQLANEAADGTLNDTQRQALDQQYSALFNEINNIAQSTQFNGISLLLGGNVSFQVGPDNGSNNQLTVNLPNVTAAGLLGAQLPNSVQLFSSGASQNVTISAPGANVVTLGATNASTGGSPNQVAAAATNGKLNGQAPASITLRVTGVSNPSGVGVVGTDSITFVVEDSNGAVSSPITINAANTAITNVDGLGFDLGFNSGDSYSAGDQITLVFGAGGTSASIATQAAAQQQVTQTKDALASLAQFRGQIGASEQQLATISSNLQSESQSLTGALSNIQDADVASTFAAFTKGLVLQQAEVAVLRQAEQAPQQLLALFQ